MLQSIETDSSSILRLKATLGKPQRDGFGARMGFFERIDLLGASVHRDKQTPGQYCA